LDIPSNRYEALPQIVLVSESAAANRSEKVGNTTKESSVVTPDGKKFQLSTFCRKESGSKIFTFSYGLTTLEQKLNLSSFGGGVNL
jgi:hypothetical protein